MSEKKMKIAIHDILTNRETLLSPDSRIRFGTGRERITVTVDNGMLEIRGDETRLLIIPEVSNTILVVARDKI